MRLQPPAAVAGACAGAQPLPGAKPRALPALPAVSAAAAKAGKHRCAGADDARAAKRPRAAPVVINLDDDDSEAGGACVREPAGGVPSGGARAVPGDAARKRTAAPPRAHPCFGVNILTAPVPGALSGAYLLAFAEAALKRLEHAQQPKRPRALVPDATRAPLALTVLDSASGAAVQLERALSRVRCCTSPAARAGDQPGDRGAARGEASASPRNDAVAANAAELPVVFSAAMGAPAATHACAKCTCADGARSAVAALEGATMMSTAPAPIAAPAPITCARSAPGPCAARGSVFERFM